MATPINTNTLVTTGFQIQITRTDTLSFFAQRVNIPGLTINNPRQQNPFTAIPIPGDHGSWESLQISFMIDEDLKNWEEVFNWYTGITFPRDYSDFSTLANDSLGPKPRSEVNMYAQVTVTVLNNHKVPICDFIFEDCIPAQLEGPTFDITQQDIQPAMCVLTLDFSNYRMRRSGQA